MEQSIRDYWGQLSGNTASAAVKVTYREAGRAAWYLAMHTCKDDQRPADKIVGRWWGKINGPKVEEYQLRTNYGQLDESQCNRLRRIARRMSKGRLRLWKEQSFSVFMAEHTQLRVLRYLAEMEKPENPF